MRGMGMRGVEIDTVRLGGYVETALCLVHKGKGVYWHATAGTITASISVPQEARFSKTITP